jgi:uncharacterized membrane protein
MNTTPFLAAFTASQELLGQTASAANSDHLAGLWRNFAAALRQLQELILLPADVQLQAQQWLVIATDAEKALQERQYDIAQRYIDALAPARSVEPSPSKWSGVSPHLIQMQEAARHRDRRLLAAATALALLATIAALFTRSRQVGGRG